MAYQYDMSPFIDLRKVLLLDCPAQVAHSRFVKKTGVFGDGNRGKLGVEMECWEETKVVCGKIEENGKLTRVYADQDLETVFQECCKTVEGFEDNFSLSFCAKIVFT